jgi:hypothetical protein
MHSSPSALSPLLSFSVYIPLQDELRVFNTSVGEVLTGRHMRNGKWTINQIAAIKLAFEHLKVAIPHELGSDHVSRYSQCLLHAL